MRYLHTVPALLALAFAARAEEPALPPDPPVTLKMSAPAVDIQVNGFGQLRYSSPDPDHLQFALGQYSVTLKPRGDERLTVFAQAAATTIGGAQSYLLEGWASYDVTPAWKVQAGRFALPFSRQFITSPANLLFPDISSADAAFNAPYAWGSLAAFTRGRLSVTGGLVTAATPLDRLDRTPMAGQAGAIGRIDAKLIGDYGFQESDPGSVGRTQLSAGLAAYRNPHALASGLQNTLSGDSANNFTVDGGFRRGRLSLQSAAYLRRIAWLRQHGDAWGAYAQSGFYVLPRRLELTARLSAVDLGRVRNPDAAGNLWDRSAGANLYLRGHYLKLQADYTWSHVKPFAGPEYRTGLLRVQMQFAF